MISSDLSHYHPYAAAQRLDEATARAIEALDETALGPQAACGHLPIAGLLLEARRRGFAAERLDLRNSGDTAGSRDSVVGYGAWCVWGRLRWRETVRLLAGSSGFAYKPWKGPFYPADLPDAGMLAYYAARLPTVEINNTFYRLPKAEVLAGWAGQTPAGFRFVLKASRRITHIQRLKEVGELVDYLFTTAATLGDRLGPLLFQLPPHMKKDLDRLRAFSTSYRKERQVALEFRHASWFEDDVFDAAARPRRRALLRRDRQRRQGGRGPRGAAGRDRVLGLSAPAPRRLHRRRA